MLGCKTSCCDKDSRHSVLHCFLLSKYLLIISYGLSTVMVTRDTMINKIEISFPFFHRDHSLVEYTDK